jgi:hypothetical protein
MTGYSLYPCQGGVALTSYEVRQRA